jgi:hypothetical protein
MTSFLTVLLTFILVMLLFICITRLQKEAEWMRCIDDEGHEWGMWEVDSNYSIRQQRRSCKKCGFTEEREVI